MQFQKYGTLNIYRGQRDKERRKYRRQSMMAPLDMPSFAQLANKPLLVEPTNIHRTESLPCEHAVTIDHQHTVG